MYANVVTVRATTSELILDFGCVVDPPENISGPANFNPDVRIILSVDATRKLGELFLKAANEQATATATATRPVAEQA